MTYFYLHSHCYLVHGTVNSAVYDIFQGRLLWLNRPVYREAIRALEGGMSLEQYCEDSLEPFEQLNKFCTFLQTLDFGTFYQHPIYPEKFRPFILPGQERMFSLHQPLERVTLELTGRCSYRCRLCAMRDGLTSCRAACGAWNQSNGMGTPLSTDEYEQLLLALHCNGCKQILIQGGDPFLVPDLLHWIIDHADEYKIPVMIQAPAQSFSDAEWNYLCDRGVQLIVPVFGDNAKDYEEITGITGSYSALQDLLSKNRAGTVRPVLAKLILTPKTLLRKDAMIRQLNEFGVRMVFTEMYLSGEERNMDHPDAIRLYDTLCPSEAKDFKVPMEVFFHLAKGHPCWQTLAITAQGDILPCLAARDHVIGSLHDEPLLSVLRNQSHDLYRNTSHDSYSPCRDCEFRYGCRSCALITEEITGDWTGRSWNCRYHPEKGDFDPKG